MGCTGSEVRIFSPRPKLNEIEESVAKAAGSFFFYACHRGLTGMKNQYSSRTAARPSRRNEVALAMAQKKGT
jgi:hypothetical protein